MKMQRPVVVMLLLFLLSQFASAQTKQVTGRITNANGEPVAGVNVLTDNKSSATQSGSDGIYTIKVSNKTTTLIFSFVGLQTQTVEIGKRTLIDVQMLPSLAALDDVVVIGYGTQRKSHLTGAISKYQNEKLDEIPVTRLDQALQGKIAGVQVQNLNSEAGGTPRIRVRGLNSVSANADPLVVIDGHILPPEAGGLSFVNVGDVQSIEVLKDAASSAIYGSRGANGVIIVTTKSGKTDKTKYTVKISNGVRSPYKTQDMMTVTEYVNLLYAEADLRNSDPGVPANRKNLITNNERAQYAIEQNVMGGKPFNWQNEGVRSNALLGNVQLSLSGGRKEAKYFFSGAYQKEEGQMFHNDYQRLSLRGKFETQLGKRVRFNINLNPTYSQRERPANNYIDFIRFPSFMPARHTDSSARFANQNPLFAHIRSGDWAQPTHYGPRLYSSMMPDGTLWTATTAVDPFTSSNNNPKSVMETRSINNNEYRMLSSSDLIIDLGHNLDFKTTASSFVTYSEGVDFAQTGNQAAGDPNRGIFTSRLLIDLLSENTLNYNKSFGDHAVTGLTGFTAQKTKIKNARTEGRNFPSENVRTINNAGVIEYPTYNAADDSYAGTYTLEDNTGLISWLGRATYAYKDKYLASASIRADGSSIFAPGRRWGYFPSASFGWVVSKESFMRDVSYVSNLKLRTSYGVTGNNRIASGLWLDRLFSSGYVFGSGTGSVVTGQVPSSSTLSNPDITWEQTYQYNFGMDLALFQNAVSLSIESYQSKSNKLLLRRNVLGFTGATQGIMNIGRLQNRGIEVELTSNNFRRKNFTWTTTFNLSANKNKMLEFGGEQFQLTTGEGSEVYITEVGQRSIRFWGYKTDGVWLTQTDADAAKAKEATLWGTNGTAIANYYTAGGLKFIDVNNDGKIDPNDRTDIGGPFPDFTYGLNNSLTYKNFDLSFLIQGVQGAELINGDARYNESRRYNRAYNNGNRWLSDMYPGDGKTPYFNNGANTWTISDYTVEDASYAALREIIFGYKLPQKVASIAKLSSLRAYISVQNAYIRWAGSYRGINPEARTTSGSVYGSPLVDGYQRGAYPMPRTILFGLDINF